MPIHFGDNVLLAVTRDRFLKYYYTCDDFIQCIILFYHEIDQDQID